MKIIATVALGLALVGVALLASAKHFATCPTFNPEGVEEALFTLLSVVFGCLTSLASLVCAVVVATKWQRSMVRLLPLCLAVSVVLAWAVAFTSGVFGL